MPPITITISIPSDYKKNLDQLISDAKSLLSTLTKNKSDSIKDKFKKAFVNKNTVRKELVSVLIRVYIIYADFPTYTSSKLTPILGPLNKLKGIMNDPKLVPHIKSAQNMISQKTCKEIVWTKILQDFYSSTNRYMQIISISMALISSTKKQIPGLLKYSQTILTQIAIIHEHPDTGPIHTKKTELKDYNEIFDILDSIQTQLFETQKKLPAYSKALSAQVYHITQTTGELSSFVHTLSSRVSFAQAEKTVNGFRSQIDIYNKLSQEDKNPLLSDVSEMSRICSDLENQLKNPTSPLVKKIADFTKNYGSNPSKNKTQQDNGLLAYKQKLLDIMKMIPLATSDLDKSGTIITPLIKLCIGVKDQIIEAKDEIDQIHQNPSTGIIHTKLKEQVEYNKVNSHLTSLASQTDDFVRECESALNLIQQLKNNFFSYQNRSTYLQTKSESIKDLQKQVSELSKNATNDMEQVKNLYSQVQKLSSKQKQIQERFNHYSTKKLLSDYKGHYK